MTPLRWCQEEGISPSNCKNHAQIVTMNNALLSLPKTYLFFIVLGLYQLGKASRKTEAVSPLLDVLAKTVLMIQLLVSVRTAKWRSHNSSLVSPDRTMRL